MLYTQAVKGELILLLERLMKDNQLNDFRLVGGTALALQIGHRLSIDIDLFSPKSFDNKLLNDHLIKSHNFNPLPFFKNSLRGTIDGIAIDIIAHEYNDVNPPLVINNIRMASLEDIAAMKFNAIVGSGTRLKDFVDVAFLSTKMSLKRMAEAYQTKYPTADIRNVTRALRFHDDINFSVKIDLANNVKMDWRLIQKRFDNMFRSPNLVFSTPPIEEDLNIKKGRGRKM